MNTEFLDIVVSTLPELAQDVPLFKPFIRQYAAVLHNEAHRQGFKTPQQIGDFYAQVMVKPLGDIENEHIQSSMIEPLAEELTEVYESSELMKQGVLPIPAYKPSKTAKKSKGSKSKGKSTKDAPKVTNPATGSKITIGGDAFKKAVKESLLTSSGELTIQGEKKLAQLKASRPKRIKNPIKKGTINLGGPTYQELLAQGWSYDEENKEWTEPPKKKKTKKSLQPKPSKHPKHKSKEEQEESEEENKEEEREEEDEEENKEKESEEEDEEENKEEEREEEDEEENKEKESEEEDEEENKEKESEEEDEEGEEGEEEGEGEEEREEEGEKEQEEGGEEEESEEEGEQKDSPPGRMAKLLEITQSSGESVRIKHPQKKYKIKIGGTAFQRLEAEGWSYDVETGVWSHA
jgi:hypothetical protein